MADIRVVQQVRQGSTTEYYATAGQAVAIAAADKLIMSFDAEINIDELIVKNGGTLDWDLNIVYPQTGISNFIIAGSGDYSLNGGDASASAGPSLKTWFRLPANSTLQLTFSNVTTSGVVELLVIGR